VRLQRSSNAIVFSLLAGACWRSPSAVIAVGGAASCWRCRRATRRPSTPSAGRRTSSATANGWNRGQAELADELRGNLAEDVVATCLLGLRRARYLDAKVGVLYATAEQGDTLERLATFACPAEGDGHPRPSARGVLDRTGRARRAGRDPVRRARGSRQGRLGHRRVGAASPAARARRGRGTIVAVLELGFSSHRPRARSSTSRDDRRSRRLVDPGGALSIAPPAAPLSETQRQSEELQVRQEELRVSNEGARGEKSQALSARTRRRRPSREELGGDQRAARGADARSEEQRDRLEEVQRDLLEKAEQLGRAYQYKSSSSPT
jgi:hypothetical protein